MIETREPTARLADDNLLELYEHAPFGQVSTDSRWSIIRANATFAELIGCSREELIGRSLTDLMSSGSRIYHETHYAPLLAMQGHVDEVTGELVRADGSRIAVMLRSLLVDGDGTAPVIRTGFVRAEDRRSFEAAIQSARRRAEASERRLAVLSRLVAALAASADVADVADAVVTTVGQPGNDMTGVWLADPAGRLRPLLGNAHDERSNATASSSLAGAWRGQRVVVDEEHGAVAVPFGPRDHGGVVVIDLDRLPRDPGPPLGEATKLTSGEEVGTEELELLSVIGREVDQALQRARLYEHKDWLLGVAAHDLRSPLTAMIGNAQTLELLLADRLEDRDRQLLERIASAGSRMAALIDDVLEYSSIEAGTLVMNREPTDPLQLVVEVVRDHATAAAAKGMRLELVRDTEGTPVLLDPRRIRQVVDNLVSNAVKYGDPASSVQIELSEKEEMLSLVVADQGQGISENEFADVFVPFGRTSSRPTGSETSTGLGLSIARTIVEAHGGSIEVASRPGEGATFTVLLPSEGADAS